jgi:heptaprenyl diphosphate synthase
MKNTKAKMISLYGMLLALSMVLSYVEAMIPVNIGVPGVKLGLPNIVTVIGLYSIGTGATIIISLLRIFLVAFTFGNAMTLAYSLSGFALSLVFMLLLKKLGGFSRIAISVSGGVMHNLGQLGAAVVLLHSQQLFYYFPVLLAAGVISGAVIGLLAGLVTERIRLYLNKIA